MSDSVKSFGKIQGDEVNIVMLCNQVSQVLEQSDEYCSGLVEPVVRKANWSEMVLEKTGSGRTGYWKERTIFFT